MIPSILSRLDLLARAVPEQPALWFEGGVWTYGRLLADVDRLARVLAAHGAAGRRVAVDLPTHPDHVVALLAVLRVGATAVPLDEKWTREQAEQRAELCGVALVLRHEDDVVRVHRRDGGRPAATGPVPFLMAPTGGTSGVPKAVVISEQASLARTTTQAVEFGFRAETTYLSATPMFHGGGRSFVLSQLYLGGQVLLHPRFDLEQHRAALREADLAFVVPTMLRRLAADPPGMVPTTLLVSGAPLGGDSSELLRAVGVARAHDYYASVEAGPIAVRTFDEGRLVSAGLAFGVHLPELPAGPVPDAGHVLEGAAVAGHGVADGIVEAGTFAPYPAAPGGGRVVRMADRVRVLPGLALAVEGRVDDVIITGGVNVFPAEVEDALRAVPGVADAVVVGVPDVEWGQAVAAALRVRPGTDLDAVRTQLRGRLAGPQVPKRYLVLDQLPLTSVGKTDRRRVLALLDESGN